MSQPSTRERWVRRTGWFLAIVYLLAAPIAASVEANGHALSERFEVSPTLIYLTSALQLLCAFAIRRPRIATLAAAALCFTTIGAFGAHLRIGSPLTSITAAVFTAIQIWYGLAMRPQAARFGASASTGATDASSEPGDS